MDSLGDLLGKFQAQEPPEIALIKRYINEQFGTPASIAVRDDSITITVPSAALAATLRMRTRALQAISKTEKRLIFRIGG